MFLYKVAEPNEALAAYRSTVTLTRFE